MRTIFSLVFVAFSFFCHAQVSTFNYFPKVDPNYQIIHYQNFSLAYSEKHEQAVWVAYELTKEEVETKVVDRKNNFREDPHILTGSASLNDYQNSGYDRGHLAPAADFVFAEQAMSECFYMSNMSPQLPAFNRGIWKKLEEKVRELAIENSSLFVLTGGVLNDSCTRIGTNAVAVPASFYKILLDYKLPAIKAIAFLMKNEASDDALHNYVVSIDSIETLTGLDFFPELEDYLEEQLEQTVIVDEWFPKEGKQKDAAQSEIDAPLSMQCKGIAKSTGKRCRIRYGLSNDYCRHHQDQGN